MSKEDLAQDIKLLNYIIFYHICWAKINELKIARIHRPFNT